MGMSHIAAPQHHRWQQLQALFICCAWEHKCLELLVLRPDKLSEDSWDSCLVKTLIQMLPVKCWNVVFGGTLRAAGVV